MKIRDAQNNEYHIIQDETREGRKTVYHAFCGKSFSNKDPKSSKVAAEMYTTCAVCKRKWKERVGVPFQKVEARNDAQENPA